MVALEGKKNYEKNKNSGVGIVIVCQEMKKCFLGQQAVFTFGRLRKSNLGSQVY
jgi:hypothetical protein